VYFFLVQLVIFVVLTRAHEAGRGAMLLDRLDLLGPRSGCWPHAGEVANGLERREAAAFGHRYPAAATGPAMENCLVYL
jgi:hypothetical protein